MQNRSVYLAAALLGLGSTFLAMTPASAYQSYSPFSPNYMSPQRLQPSKSLFNNNLYRHWTTGGTCYDKYGYAVRGRSCSF